MKRIIFTVLLAAVCIATMTGCGAILYGGGILYADAKQPMSAIAYYGDHATGYSKIGKASNTAILGILLTGDASLDAAMHSAAITKVHHVDTQYTNILGIIQTQTTIVYGE
jgi:hypothetical protein